jgi:hypothetical protein
MTWVTDFVFVAGGDYVRESWSDFQAQAGVSAVITVSADGPLAYRDPLPWAALWLPVEDEAAYRLDQLAMGVRFIQDALAGGRKLLLHGPKGVHRTRPLLAGHLLAEGTSLARVLRIVEEKPWLPPYKGDPAVLEQLAARLAAERAGEGPRRPARRLDSLDRPEQPGEPPPLTLRPRNDEDSDLPGLEDL